MLASQMRNPVDASYLADTVVLFRMYEHAGSVRKAISVVKKRSGPHEDTIRQLWFDADGVHPLAVGALPPQCAALNQTFLNVVELTVHAALEERRELVEQAVQGHGLAIVGHPKILHQSRRTERPAKAEEE